MRRVVAALVLAVVCLPSLALAEGAAAGDSGLISLGASIAIGLAALGGGIAQGKLVAAGLDSIGRNPASAGKLFVPMILGLVFVEAIVILSFVIAFSLQGKI